MKRIRSVLFLIGVVCVMPAFAQYDDYINRYSAIAVREMADFGIPASITLAQGLLESAAGTSDLAVKANNHFGIKCHNDWTGATMHHDDDRNQECFRKYDNAEESFVDHSQFLKSKARYAFLFEYDRTDYKSWAKGLKQAGYATDPNYATRLIDLIEKYDLHRFDTGAAAVPAASSAKPSATEADYDGPRRNSSGLKYVLARKNDSYYAIGKRYHIPFNLIYRYNDVDKNGRQPKEGEVVYLQRKLKKAKYVPFTHVVNAGESMHDIAQHYGIRIHALYDMNNMPYTAVPKAGQMLKLK
ncbi:MAG: glucosaminidase domain-containing protein [Paludibacteraceae bacterium]|nr:glucosaminidase domain-containing protein [Paludibacteraceae bacterium]